MASVEEDLQVLDNKLKQLRLDYERYFLGTRPREPFMLRGEVQKLVAIYSNQPIQNTALRFKFNSLCSRFQALKRQWDENLRKMEEGTYSRHRFKANLHDREREQASTSSAGDDPGLYEAYVAAREACGQDVSQLTPAKLQSVLAQQERALRKRYGSGDFRFKVVVEEGKAKVKASRTRD